MPNLIPTTETVVMRPADRQTSRALARLERHTLVRLASVQAESFVQAEKLHEIDHLSREAMTGQAILRHHAAVLAAGDPFLADELKHFGDLARLAKTEIISDTIANFCRETRR
jgi:hypothetical protein